MSPDDLREHIDVTADITDVHGLTERVFAGSVPQWAWQAGRCPEWRKMKREMLLADRTLEPRGWRVTFHVGGQA